MQNDHTIAVSITKEFTYKSDSITIDDNTDNHERVGTITFTNGNFLRCNFGGLNNPHDIYDWKFLSDLSDEIIRIHHSYDMENERNKHLKDDTDTQE